MCDSVSGTLSADTVVNSVLVIAPKRYYNGIETFVLCGCYKGDNTLVVRNKMRSKSWLSLEYPFKKSRIYKSLRG